MSQEELESRRKKRMQEVNMQVNIRKEIDGDGLLQKIYAQVKKIDRHGVVNIFVNGEQTIAGKPSVSNHTAKHNTKTAERVTRAERNRRASQMSEGTVEDPDDLLK